MTLKNMVLCLALILLPLSAPAAEDQFSGAGDQKFPADYHKAPPALERTQGIQKYAQDAQKGAQQNFGLQFVHDNELFAVFKGDRLEYQTREGEDVLLWDVEAWIGSDYNKIYLESEGTRLIHEGEFDEAEVELLYGRTLASFWDLRAGIRHDFEPHPTRTFAALGVQGLAPYWFETEATAYLSEDGDVSADLEVEYDILLSQRLILQPRLEAGASLQEVEELGIGQGITDVELGIRLRYEIRREFAPYVGISWSRKIGETADFAEAEGEDSSLVSFVLGLRFWF
ncbi:MAG: copper resistance protein B [Desulfohalobiaceae bacterium]|nr:copper resistance protein B [Desulfohalobiaceae bacterium]